MVHGVLQLRDHASHRHRGHRDHHVAGDARRAAGQREGHPQALPRADLQYRRRRAGAGKHVHLTSPSRDNLRGSLLMVAAMVCFALEDVLLKQISATVPVGQVLALSGAGGGLIFLLISSVGDTPLQWRALLLPAVVLRNLSEALGSVVFVTALALTRLSEVSAILQATPLAMTLGAALFLGESVGWRRWTAIGVGFAGVLLVIQPGMAGFAPASLFAVATVVLLAMRDLCSRAVPPSVPSVQLAAWGFLSLVPAGMGANGCHPGHRLLRLLRHRRCHTHRRSERRGAVPLHAPVVCHGPCLARVRRASGRADDHGSCADRRHRAVHHLAQRRSQPEAGAGAL